MGLVERYEPGRPCWVDLVTSDPDGAREFYGGLFGWTFDVGGPETGSYTYCLVGGLRAAGMVGQPVETMAPAWTTYLATHDVDATAARIPHAGGAIRMGPADAGPAGRVVIASDPAGALIGAWQAGEHPGAQVTDAPGSVVWSELRSADLDTVMPFYAQAFGHIWQEADMPGWSRYATFAVGDQLGGGATPSDSQAAGWLTYFAVADIREVTTTIERLGGSVTTPPVDSPFGRWASVSDPQGAAFAVLEPAG
jgi:predicted enzyme related to lactoylglutathione lyase